MLLSREIVSDCQKCEDATLGCHMAWCALIMVKVASLLSQGIHMTNVLDYRVTKIIPQ